MAQLRGIVNSVLVAVLALLLVWGFSPSSDIFSCNSRLLKPFLVNAQGLMINNFFMLHAVSYWKRVF